MERRQSYVRDPICDGGLITWKCKELVLPWLIWWEIWRDDVWRAIWASNNKIQRFKVCDEIMDPKNYWYTSRGGYMKVFTSGPQGSIPILCRGNQMICWKGCMGLFACFIFGENHGWLGKKHKEFVRTYSMHSAMAWTPCWERESNRSMIFQPKKQAKDCLAKGKLDTVEEITHSSVRLSLSVKYPSRNMLTTWEQRRGNKWSHRMLHSLKPRKVWT